MSDWSGTGAPAGTTPASTALEQARANLVIWQAALNAVATGQEYRVGPRMLRRADGPFCLRMVRYYEGEVARLTAGRGRGARVIRVVPRDS